MGRALAFSDPAIVRMASEDYVSVTADDWYQRRREDEEGRFFRSVAKQGPRKGEGGATQQGIYVLTPGGKLLAYRNAQDPGVMRGVLKQGLSVWKKLPEAERAPGALKVARLDRVDARYDRKVPPGAAVVDVFTRILTKNETGEYEVGECGFPGGDQAARDHLWLMPAEVEGLFATLQAKDDSRAMPERLGRRIARFHLVDNTRGEPPHWRSAEVREGKVTLTVTESNAATVRVRIEGKIVLATDANVKNAQRGFETWLLGTMTFNKAARKLEQFDMVALGEHWGEGPFTRQARPGRTPLGVAFGLARGDSAADQVPPQAARDLQGYLRAE